MKKIGILATVLMVVLSTSACGSATNNLSGTRDGYGTYDSQYGTYGSDAYGYNNTYGYNAYDTYNYDVYGYDANGVYGAYDVYEDGMYKDSYADGGAAYWDGYGINEGRTIQSNTGYSKYSTNSMLN